MQVQEVQLAGVTLRELARYHPVCVVQNFPWAIQCRGVKVKGAKKDDDRPLCRDVLQHMAGRRIYSRETTSGSVPMGRCQADGDVNKTVFTAVCEQHVPAAAAEES